MTTPSPDAVSTPAGTGPGPRPGGAGEGRDAEAILDATRAAVDPELRRALGSLPGAMRRVALHHFGWHTEAPAAGAGAGAVAAGGGHPGKAIRPALVLTALKALGGRPAAAVRAAAAVELTHNFTLLHDDVMDRDTTRRHRPTAWTVYGTTDAILAGNALQALAQWLLAEDPHPAAARAASRLARCVVELCEGQHADTALEKRPPGEVTLDECLAMAEAKTGALIGCACAIGALYAGADEPEVAALDAFGRQAGLAFQLIDDVIGIWGDPSRTGKPAGADLLAGKKSLPVVAALCSGTPAAADLAAFYAAPRTERGLAAAVAALERAGGRDWAQYQAAERMSHALHRLSTAVPHPTAAGELLAVAEYVTRRSA